MQTALFLKIQQEKDHLVMLVGSISPSVRALKVIDGTAGKVSISDLIAYQIGWGKCLIRWYEAGIEGKIPEMPGEGFSTWDYNAVAKHFYQRYTYDTSEQQISVFHEVVSRILEITQAEYQKGNLDRLGVWPWCTLSSGKQWPLSKWIQVNTVAPYKRAIKLIKKTKL
ncbi:MAG: ClbS/DfsB family four-helix bundle protein [Parachlamydiaceae bacterium]|nr:ClbS/DfsB family four-helix bundle protein [Parachlamydiaceae bacterium]